MNKHKCLLITTGGTIGGKINKERLYESNTCSSDFLSIVEPAICDIEKVHNLRVEISEWNRGRHGKDAIDEDSSDIEPSHWVEITTAIHNEYDNFDSFVIAHGTNTLGYTSAALTFALANINKPVILTGSQVPADFAGSDAQMNLNNAIRVAAFPNVHKGGPLIGVYLVFGSYIISGCRVKKDTEFDYDAFKSFNMGSIGRIGRAIHINQHNLHSYKEKLHTPHGLAHSQSDLVVKKNFDMNIASITEFPGMSSSIFKTLVLNGIKGIILRAFGAGDVSRKHREVIKFLKAQKIPLIVTTQAPNGISNLCVNEPGRYLRSQELAVPAYDMGIETITVKLSWLLGQGMHYEEICKNMLRNYHDEINIIEEDNNGFIVD